jgi:hypothetical protein
MDIGLIFSLWKTKESASSDGSNTPLSNKRGLERNGRKNPPSPSVNRQSTTHSGSACWQG